MSYDQLEPSLDAFANAMVEIENLVGPDAGVISIPSPNGNMPTPQTFYFKIPPNDKLLGYWTTVADRLYKLRHCQNIAGGALELALFDAPIDPGLLIAAQAAGVDLTERAERHWRFPAQLPVHESVLAGFGLCERVAGLRISLCRQPSRKATRAH